MPIQAFVDVITVCRDEWHRGKEAAEKDAYLYNKLTKKFDIIGIILAARLGICTSELHKQRVPSVIAHRNLSKNKTFSVPYQWLVNPSHTDTDDSFELIKLNDDPNLKEEEREDKIKFFLNQRLINILFQ